jgi:hypothetical protein
LKYQLRSTKYRLAKQKNIGTMVIEIQTMVMAIQRKGYIN